MNKTLIKKYVIFILGCLIMGAGIRLCEFASLGVDPMSVFDLGIMNYLPVTFGVANMIVSLAMVTIGFILDRKNVTLATFIALFAVSFGIDLFGYLPIGYQSGVMSYVLLVIGLLVYCFGIAVTQIPKCGYSAYDCIIFGFMKKTGKEYHIFRWLIDGSYAILGWLLGGAFGINTLVTFFFTGKIVEFFVVRLNKIIKF